MELTLQTGTWTGSLALNTKGLPLMGFHGFTGASADFELLLSHLGADFSFVGPNLPGHRSELNSSSRELTAWMIGLEAFAEELGSQPLNLLGYSMGGRLALHYALETRSKSLTGSRMAPMESLRRFYASRGLKMSMPVHGYALKLTVARHLVFAYTQCVHSSHWSSFGQLQSWCMVVLYCS